MAFSYQDYIGDNATTTFSIPFTYTDTSEISVTVDGVAQTGLTFPSASQVALTSAPSTGAKVQVRRTTDLTARAVDFASGSVLTEEDLDNSSIQVFHAAQEATDITADSIFLGADDKWDAKSKIIKNVATPVDTADATNKAYVDQIEADATAAQTAAEAAQAAAETAETNAAASATTATTKAAEASTSATNSAASAVASSNSASSSATSATASAGSATAAAASAAAASVSEANAGTSETNASTSETNAASSAASASTSATTATTQAGIATTQATNSSNSATASANSATASANSATASANSATSSANSATAAASSASAASTSETNAANSAAAAAAAFDNFDDTYLGSFASDPTVDNDGDPLTQGDLYFNSTANEMRVYDGANWIAASSAGAASLILYEYTATSGQTTFSGADDNAASLSYSVGNIQVVMNGVILDPSDYTATSGTSVVLASGAATGDLVNIYAFKSFTVADTVSASAGGTFAADVAFSSNITMNSDDPTITMTDSSGINDIATLQATSGAFIVTARDGSADGEIIFKKTDGSTTDETMRISSSGNVGIGTSNPSAVNAGSDDLVIGDATGNRGLTILSGTTGLSLITFNDGFNTSRTGGLQYDHSNNSFAFRANNTEKMLIDSSGNVGIGTSSPTSNRILDANGQVRFQSSSSGRYFDFINDSAASYLDVSHSLNIRTNGASSLATAMTLDSSGNVLVGTTTANPADANDASGAQISQAGTIQASSSGSTPAIFNRGSDGAAVAFLRSGSLVGSISITTTSTAYNTSSDYRLKENVTYDWDATTRLKQLKPARFNFIADADITVDGFLAHEAQTVVPEAITGTKDAMRDEEYEITPAVLDDDGNEVTPAEMGTRSVPVYQGIDQSKLVPLLVKTIQELEARITALENV